MHWTYKAVAAGDDLAQGDILMPSDELRGVLNDVHPRFLDPRYLGFMVVSQTCDLQRRGGDEECSAPHISISAIRPLEMALIELLDHACRPLVSGAYEAVERGRAKDFLNRLLNQNEWKLGLFFLHADATIGLGDHSVATLRVSVSLPRTHYNVLRGARSGRLESQFANKLGWMVGNLYSRIGTPDWHDQVNGSEDLDELVGILLNEARDDDGGVLWVSPDELRAAKTHGVDLKAESRAGVRNAIGRLATESVLDLAVREVEREAKRILDGAKHAYGDDAKTVEELMAVLAAKIGNRLRNNGGFKKCIVPLESR